MKVGMSKLSISKEKIGLSKRSKPTITFYDVYGECKLKHSNRLLNNYTLELQQDLQVLHGIDIEAEMLNILRMEMNGNMLP